MPFQVDGTCYETALAASQAIAARESGRVVGDYETFVVGQPDSDGDASLNYQRLSLVDGTSTFSHVYAPLIPCNTFNPFLLTSEQGALIATAVGAIWAAAYGWKALGRALNSDGEKD